MINEKEYKEYVKFRKWVESHSIEYLELMYNVKLTWYQKIFIKYFYAKKTKEKKIYKILINKKKRCKLINKRGEIRWNIYINVIIVTILIQKKKC